MKQLDRHVQVGIGERVWWALRKRGITQSALAEQLGMSQTTLSRKMLGKATFYPDELVALAAQAEGWVFPSPHGGHLGADRVGKILARALGAGYSAHTLRHRFASRAYTAQRDLRAVQELLGHSKPETTARYVAVPDDALAAAVAAAA